jgi:hypothetical protein
VGRRGPRRRLTLGPPGADHNQRRPRLHDSEDNRLPAQRETYSDGHRSPQKPSRAPAGRDRWGKGSLWSENGLIFATETGDPLDRRTVTTLKFKPLLKHVSLPEIRFHDLRHTCATLLLTQNVNPKIVLRDARAFDHGHHPRHLFPRAAEHARCGCGGDGRGTVVAYCCRTAAKAPGNVCGGFLVSAQKRAICRVVSTGGRARTDTVLSHHRILSPARLPIPPLRRASHQGLTPEGLRLF